MNFIIIDGSYFIFYRYHALRIWWGLAKREDETNDYCENERFIEKFRETFVAKIQEMTEKLNIDELMSKKIIELVKVDQITLPRRQEWRGY